jgi:hypothetical protein
MLNVLFMIQLKLLIIKICIVSNRNILGCVTKSHRAPLGCTLFKAVISKIYGAPLCGGGRNNLEM